MVDAALISRVRTLSAADRLELIGAVWETLSPADAPITEAEKSLLDARLADVESNPEDQSTWLEVQARLRHLLP
ncbi:MAG: addiction module protein [Nevskiales bacterium]